MGEEFELKKPEMCVVGPDGEPHPLDSIIDIPELDGRPDYVITAYYDLFWILIMSEISTVDNRKIKRYLRRYIKAIIKSIKELGKDK